MNRAPRIILCSALCVIFTSCSASSGSSGSIDSLTGAAQHESLVVAQTVEQQAKSEIEDTPTDFAVTLDDDKHAWERARFFIEKYLSSEGNKAPVMTKIVGARWGLVSQLNSGSYIYEVWKQPMRNGYRYTVKCSPKKGGTLEVAVANAQNLARFIKDGKLEIAQIVR